MAAGRERMSYRGFRLRLENGFSVAEARAAVDRAMASGGDRVAFVMTRAGAEGDPRPARVFVKAEFRRPDQPLAKRLRASRALAEGRGYRAFAAAGLETPRLFAFGEQSRLRPRAGAIVVTEKIRGKDAARLYRRDRDADVLERAARTLARVHAAGLVHGDAVLRNFVLVPGREYLLDLPGWKRWTPKRAELDLSRCAGSSLKLGAERHEIDRLFGVYDSAKGPAAALPAGWRERAEEAAREYLRHLLEKDATREARHARRRVTRIRERSAETDGRTP